MPITIVTVGKKHESWIAEGIERFQKRLKQPFKIEWVILPSSSLNGLAARQDESRAIIPRVNGYDYLVLLDEKGENISSTKFSNLIGSQLDKSQKVAFIIGGAYGVDDTIHERANFVWSLSNLVFPHQLVRLILAEQIYRAQEIYFGNPYHHD
jgi:23S rRNA (pseudouridine1915-N3)-methyltransferase